MCLLFELFLQTRNKWNQRAEKLQADLEPTNRVSPAAVHSDAHASQPQGAAADAAPPRSASQENAASSDTPTAALPPATQLQHNLFRRWITSLTSLAHVVEELKAHFAADDEYELSRAILRRITDAAQAHNVVFDRVRPAGGRLTDWCRSRAEDLAAHLESLVRDRYSDRDREVCSIVVAC